MTSAFVTFVLSMAIVLGAYVIFVILPEQRASRRLRGRLRPDTPDVRTLSGLTKSTQPLSAVKYVDALLTRSGRLIAPLRYTVDHSGLPVTVGLVVLGSIFAMLLGAVVLQVSLGIGWLTIVGAFLFALIPYGFVRHAAHRRLRKFEDQFPQSMDLIAGALRAGHAFTTGRVDGGRRSTGSNRRGVQAAVRPAELRNAAARRAQGVRCSACRSWMRASSLPRS